MQIGYMSQEVFSLHELDLSIMENLEFFAGVYGVPENWNAPRRIALGDPVFGPGEEGRPTGGQPAAGLGSSGWHSGAAILHEPSILFLDEPTSGKSTPWPAVPS